MQEDSVDNAEKHAESDGEEECDDDDEEEEEDIMGDDASRSEVQLQDSVLDRPVCETWEGANQFICGGRIMLGVDVNQLYITVGLVVGTWILHIVVCIAFYRTLVILQVLGPILFIIECTSLSLAASTDPGILPRLPANPVEELLTAQVKDKIHLCPTCHLIRPPRAKHCRFCDNCVDLFDHHCPWLGTCIGRRNYRWFLSFIFFTFIASIYMSLLFIITATRAAHTSTLAGVVEAFTAGLLAAWVLIISGFVGALLQFHLYLILFRDQTTNEFLRSERATSSPSMLMHAPHRFMHLCCSPVPPSRLGDTHKPPNQSYRNYITSAYSLQHNRIETLITQSSRSTEPHDPFLSPDKTPPSTPERKAIKRSSDVPVMPLLSAFSPTGADSCRNTNGATGLSSSSSTAPPAQDRSHSNDASDLMSGGIALV